MGILLIGCGYWGNNWAKTLFELGELAGICEGNTLTHQHLQQTYPIIPIVDNLTDALAINGVEGAVVATPVQTHQSVASQCLAAGIPTLVEKPMTTDAAEAEMLVALAKEKNIPLAVGHICLFYPAIQRAKALIADGVIGDVLNVTCVRQKLGKLRNEESVWWSFAPHDISIVLDIYDNVPLLVDSVSANRALGRAGLEDAVSATLVTPAGQQASIHVGWLAGQKTFTTTITGTKGVIEVDHAGSEQTLTLTSYTLNQQGDEAELTNIQPPVEETFTQQPSALTMQASAFLAAIREGKPLPNTGDNGHKVVEILHAVQSELDKLPAMLKQ